MLRNVSWYKEQLVALLLALFTCGCLSLAMAQDKPSTPSIETSGFVDFYYSKNFAQPLGRTNKFRNFDIAENQFNLSLAEIVFQKNAQPVGFRIDADFGSANDVVETGVSGTLTNVQQAYLTAVLPVGKGITMDVGKFVTSMGYEVIESRDNWNYSRSLLFAWAIPYFHVGARISYPVLENLTVTGHIVNGWNNVVDNNDSKSFGVMVSYAPLSSTSLVFNWMGGPEQPTGQDVGNRNVFDFVLTQQVNDNLSLGLNADYGQERIVAGLPRWKGLALYGRYGVDAKSALALRGEVYSDVDGYTTGVAQDVKEVTVTYEYKFADALLIRVEFRHDWSNADVFDTKSATNADKNQDTILLGTVLSF